MFVGKMHMEESRSIGGGHSSRGRRPRLNRMDGENDRATILTMAGGRFSVWSLVNGAQHSPSRVKSGPGAACYASRWDVAPGGPDRARSCHWPPLTPPRTTHCSTCPPCRLVPRVTSYPRRGSDVETVEHFSRGSRWYRSRRCSRSQDSRVDRYR